MTPITFIRLLFYFFFTVNTNRNAEDLSIPELGATSSVAGNNVVDTAIDDEDNHKETNTEFVNPPSLSWVYTDLDLKCTFVNVVLPIISGSKDIHFNISEDGMQVVINYSWSPFIYIPKELFAHEINNEILATHPKIHSLSMQLLESGITEKSIPRGKIIVTLPIKVQREVGSWTKKTESKSDGTKIVFLQFKGYQEKQIIKDADTSLVFD